MSRSVLFDTETTGLDPATGDRILEIAAIELVRELPTARHFHHLIDPERDVPDEATRIHGYTRGHVLGKPRFADIVDAFLDFVGDSPLVAHNAPFDFAFVNAELARLSIPPLHESRMICTLALAKARYPGMPNSLNALCHRFSIDLSERISHNALLDCRLLADVYVELMGGRQGGLLLNGANQSERYHTYTRPPTRQPTLFVPTAEQLQAHAAFTTRIKATLWKTP